MAAVGIVGLAIGSAANLRTILLSARQRYEHLSDNNEKFNDVVDDLARITENLREIEQNLNRRVQDDNRGHVDRHLKTANKRLLASQKILDKLGNGPLQVHSGPSFAHLSGMCSRITGANRIHDKLNKVSANFCQVDGLLDTVATLLSISEHACSAEGVDKHRGVSSVPTLTHQEVLDFDGKDENGNLTPEAQLKIHVLNKQSNKVVAAAGRHRAKVPSAQGMAGVGKTVALKGLGSDRDIRKAFDEIHYMTLGHDATADTVVSELARVVKISGGERQEWTVLRCKDVNEAVSHASSWFSGRKCLFLVDDVWKTGQSNYGYLPALRQLLATSEESRMVISTRDRNIASEAGQAVEFGPRGNTTSREMFLGYFGGEVPETLLRSGGAESLDKILNLCGGMPLALAVTGRGARALKDEGRNPVRALDEYANRLEGRRLNLLENTLPEYGRENESLTLRAAIETGLDFLGGRDEVTITSCDIVIGDMYRALGVLKAQAWAPVSALSKLWNVDRDDAERIMGQLCIMSLAEVEDHTFKVVRSSEEHTECGLKLHDLQLEYCRQRCKDMSGWHCRLLDGYLTTVEGTITQGLDADACQEGADDSIVNVEPRSWWSEGLAEDGYVHENIAWHLVKAGKRDELCGLLVDARWIKLRLVIGGILALENDFAELLRMEDNGIVDAEGSATESSCLEFRAVLNALRCSWQYLVQNERELAVQLGGRLFDVQESSAAARKLVKSAIGSSEGPFAEAQNGFLPDARSGQVNEVYLGGYCRSLSYSSCGKYIAVAAGKDVVVVESDTLAARLRFKGHTEDVRSVCFFPRSPKIVSGSYDGTVRVWDLSRPEDGVLTLKGCTAIVCSVCVSPDGSRVAAGFEDKTVRLWNLQEDGSDGEETKTHSKWMSWFCCIADDANGTEDVETGAYRCQVLRGYTSSVRHICFSPDGALLASVSGDGTVRLWNSRTDKHTSVTAEGCEGDVFCVAFSPDGEHVASGFQDGTIRLWRADSSAPAGIVMDGGSNSVNSVAFSADGSRIVSACGDETVRLWCAGTGAAIGAALKGHTNRVNSAVFSPDGIRVASVSQDGTLRIWEPEKAREASAAREARPRSVWCAGFSADCFRIAMGYFDGAILIWDTQDCRAVGGPLEGHTEPVTCVAFSPNGAVLASGSNDNTVRLWNVHTGTAMGGALEGHSSWVDKVSFSADGSKLLSYSSLDNCRCSWSVPSGARLWMSRGSSEDPVNVLSAEAQAAVEAIEHQSFPDASEETAVVYYDSKDSAVKMKHNEGDVRLASLPPLPQHASGTLWMHIAERNEFAAVLMDGTPVCLKLHV